MIARYPKYLDSILTICPRDLIMVREAKRVPRSACPQHHHLCNILKILPSNFFWKYVLFLSKCRTMITVYSMSNDAATGHVAWYQICKGTLWSLDILKYLNSILTISHRDPSSTSRSIPAAKQAPPITQSTRVSPRAVYAIKNTMHHPRRMIGFHKW
jgi:hypothetical protein